MNNKDAQSLVLPAHQFISSVSKLTGSRYFCPVSFGDNPSTVSALYDTGSGVTALSVDTFRLARKVGAVSDEIKDHTLSLTNASGGNMPIHGVFWCHMNIAGKSLHEPVVVIPGLSSPMIIGQNVITAHGLTYEPSSSSFRFLSNTRSGHDVSAIAGWTRASLHAVKSKSIPANSGVLIKAYAKIDSSTPLPPFSDLLATINGVDNIIQTDHNGIATFYLTNPLNEDIDVARGDEVGFAEPFDHTRDHVVKADEHLLKSFCMGLNASRRKNRQQQPQAVDPDKLKLINDCLDRSDVPQDLRTPLRTLLVHFQDIISKDSSDVGHSTSVKHSIRLRDQEPVYTKQYRLTEDETNEIVSHIRMLLDAGIIERTHSRFNSAIFCVKKKTGGYRMVLDYRRLNSKSLVDKYSIRTTEDLIAEIGKSEAKVFSSLDLRNGFWQMELEESSRPYTAFTVLGEGQFRWIRAPFGLAGCPASFSRIMDLVTKDLDNTVNFIDDLLTFSSSFGHHLNDLSRLFEQLRRHHLKLNLEKCNIAVQKVEFLGHTLHPNGISPGIDKTKAILESGDITTTKQLKSFIGLCNFFRDYIGHFAKKAAPLYALTRNSSLWKGGPLPKEAQEAVNILKRELTASPVLAFPRQDGLLHLFIDGSLGTPEAEGGLGAVLMQEQEGKLRPIAFASRRLQGHEKNYSAFLIELAAAVYAVDHFSVYLRSRHFVLHSDHKPMSKLSTVHTKTLNRLQQMMMEYTFIIRWVKAQDNMVADFLSRNASGHPPSSISAISSFLLRAQEQDPDIAQTVQALQKNDPTNMLQVPRTYRAWFNNLAVKDGHLLIQVPPRKGFSNESPWKVVCPLRMRTQILEKAHASIIGGHSGTLKTKERIRDKFWWPNMDRDISDYLSKCLVCQQYANKNIPTRSPGQSLPRPTKPNETVHVDLFGPLVDEENKKNFVLVITDSFSKFVKLVPLPDKSAVTVARAIRDQWIHTFGVMKNLISDSGLEFANSLQEAICDLLKIDHKRTSPYWPRTNAACEVFNKTMAHYLRTVMSAASKSTVNWKDYLGPLMFSYNTAAHRAIKMSPFSALFGYPDRAPLFEDMEVLLEKDFAPVKSQDDQEFLREWTHTLRETRKLAHANNLQDQESHLDEDKRKSPDATFREFHPGQKVWILIKASQEKNSKLAPKWEPGVIERRLSDSTYRVNRMNRRRHKVTTWNVEYLKERSDSDDDQEDEPDTNAPRQDNDDNDGDEIQIPQRQTRSNMDLTEKSIHDLVSMITDRVIAAITFNKTKVPKSAGELEEYCMSQTDFTPEWVDKMNSWLDTLPDQSFRLVFRGAKSNRNVAQPNPNVVQPNPDNGAMPLPIPPNLYPPLPPLPTPHPPTGKVRRPRKQPSPRKIASRPPHLPDPPTSPASPPSDSDSSSSSTAKSSTAKGLVRAASRKFSKAKKSLGFGSGPADAAEPHAAAAADGSDPVPIQDAIPEEPASPARAASPRTLRREAARAREIDREIRAAILQDRLNQIQPRENAPPEIQKLYVMRDELEIFQPGNSFEKIKHVSQLRPAYERYGSPPKATTRLGLPASTVYFINRINQEIARAGYSVATSREFSDHS